MRDFADSHPVTLLTFFAAVMIAAMAFTHPAMLAAGFVGAFAYLAVLKGKKAFLFLAEFCLPTLILVTLVNGLTAHYGVTPLFTLPWDADVRLEPLIRGLVTGVSVVTELMWFSALNEVIDSEKLVFIMSARLPKLSVLISSVLRFTPLYSRQLKETFAYRQALFGGSGLKNAARSLEAVLYSGAERSIITANSMVARGYGLPGSKAYDPYRFRRSDAVLTSVILICSVLLIAGGATGAAKTLWNPVITFPARSPMLFITAAAALILATLPVMQKAVFSGKKLFFSDT